MRVLAWPAFKNKSLNPYNWLLYTHLVRLGVKVEEFSAWKLLRGHCSIWHLHWPERYFNDPDRKKAWFKSRMLLNLVKWARARGVKIVWTIHNLWAHEGFHRDLEVKFWQEFTGQVDGYISLSNTGVDLARKRFRNLDRVPGIVIPHGHYCGVYPDSVTREQARRRLGLSMQDKVALFLGQVRPYKNVPHLIRVFRQVEEPQVRLVVAGKVDLNELRQQVIEEAGGDPRIFLSLSFVPDEELQVFLRAADLVVLPYREILNSGSAILALSYDRPVLVPELGALSELKKLVGSSWVYTYSGELTPAVFTSALNWAVKYPRGARPSLGVLGWENLAKRTLEFYKSLMKQVDSTTGTLGDPVARVREADYDQ